MRIVASLFIAVPVALVGAGASIYAGIYDVTATEPIDDAGEAAGGIDRKLGRYLLRHGTAHVRRHRQKQ